jgi:SAM-dependent methyltransferase
MNAMRKDEIVRKVRAHYAHVARQDGACGCSVKSRLAGGSCCSPGAAGRDVSRSIGYSDDEMDSVPEGANLGLGCGNPLALASLKPGDVVLDLGSGAGFDCFLAAAQVGASGHVIGVDMTPDMLDRARANARKGSYGNVEFRLGEIEHLPVADGTVDAIISNCVVNLSSDKPQVFREAFRVLKPGGRLMVSDIVLAAPLPEAIRSSVEAYVGCVAGADLKEDYLSAIRDAGFRGVEVADESVFPIDCIVEDPTVRSVMKKDKMTLERVGEIASQVLSVKVSAVKPA